MNLKVIAIAIVNNNPILNVSQKSTGVKPEIKPDSPKKIKL